MDYSDQVLDARIHTASLDWLILRLCVESKVGISHQNGLKERNVAHVNIA